FPIRPTLRKRSLRWSWPVRLARRVLGPSRMSVVAGRPHPVISVLAMTTINLVLWPSIAEAAEHTAGEFAPSPSIDVSRQPGVRTMTLDEALAYARLHQ